MNMIAIRAGLLKNQDYLKDPCLVKLLSDIEIKYKSKQCLTDEEIADAAKRLVRFGELND